MKTIISKALTLVIIGVLGTSCKKDFLEIVPVGNKVATTVSDYELLMNDSRLYAYRHGLASMVLGDEMAADGPAFQSSTVQGQRLFYYENVVYNATDAPVDITTQTANLYYCNKIILEVMDASEGTNEKKQALLGEALATRAWLYFQFINFYGKPYGPSSASDPGFPIITTADATANGFTRASVQQVYDFMISDLRTAIASLPISNGVKTRMSRPAAQALLGKIFLSMGRYQDALSILDAAYTGNLSSPSPATLYDYNVTLAPGGSFLPVGPDGPNYTGNNPVDVKETLLLKTSNGGAYNGQGFANTGLILDPVAATLFSMSDQRLKLYSPLRQNQTPIPGGRLRKYAQTNCRIGIELPDLLLMRAEAYARTGDLSRAKTDVEMLRRNRMAIAQAEVPAQVASDAAALTRFIIDERIREFAGNGMRWFDMRRLSADPLFSTAGYKHNLYGADGSLQGSYPLRAERLTLRIPQNLLDANPSMTDNP